jgi:hypothetical protein
MRNTYENISKAIVLCLCCLFASGVHAINITATPRGNLPAQLVESSGLDFTGGTHFWSLNDSGLPEIYRIASDGTLTRTVTVTNAALRNWEDMAHDASRTNLFIGDFGNNACDRTNLRIYRIPYPSFVPGNSVAAQLISFTYEDQVRFPSPWMNFDAEGFVHFQGKLYIFTKADGNAVGYTKMYSLPDVPGNHVAQLVDSFHTNDRTTGAAISPDGESLVLISNTHIHLFRGFNGDDFFGGQHTQINISGGWTQKEAVSFGEYNEIYMTDENTGSGNHLYHVDLSAWIPPPPAATTSIEKVNNSVSATVYPMPANQFANISFKNVNKEKLSIALYDLTGKQVYKENIEDPFNTFVIETAVFPTGVYFYKVFADAKEIQTSRLIITH